VLRLTRQPPYVVHLFDVLVLLLPPLRPLPLVCPRLSGDYNPLHIDPEVSRRVGFDSPILHGLASMGISVRQVLQLFGADEPGSIRSVKVGAVLWGQGASGCD
jgi:hypothetical protein